MLWLYIKTVTNGVSFTAIPIIRASGNRHRNVVLQPKEKREAQAWEREVMLKSESKLDMTFASFFEIYEADKKNG